MIALERRGTPPVDPEFQALLADMPERTFELILDVYTILRALREVTGCQTKGQIRLLVEMPQSRFDEAFKILIGTGRLVSSRIFTEGYA